MRGETLRALVVDGEERLRYSGFEGRQLGGTLPAGNGSDGKKAP